VYVFACIKMNAAFLGHYFLSFNPFPTFTPNHVEPADK